MLKFLTIEGPVVYIDPAEIVIVAPAYAPPSEGVPNNMQIPKVLGAQVILRNGMKSGVRGECGDIAAEVAQAKGRILLN